MDARKWHWILIVSSIGTMGAVHRTPNFVITAPTKEFAEEVGEAAEYYRKELAVAWLGMELPKWYRPCPINVRVGQIGAGGATTFHFDRGEVSGWKMDIQGSEQRILDSVLPHEINHTIFACYFRRPLPRWADEGAATMIEHDSERQRQTELLGEVIQDGSRFPLRQLLSIKEYPTDHRRVLTLYAQGYSLTDYLLEKQGKQTFLKFLAMAHEKGWDPALQKHYGWKNIEAMETQWQNWFMAGSPRLNLPKGDLLAENTSAAPATVPAEANAADSVVRGQTPEEPGRAIPIARSELQPAAPRVETPAPREDSAAKSASEAPIAVAARDEEPRLIVHRDTAPDAEEIRRRGKVETVLAGWEPLKPAARRAPSAERRVVVHEDRPRFADETSLTVRK